MSLVGVAEVVGAVLERLRTEVANLEEIFKSHQRFFFFPPLEMQSNIFILYAGWVPTETGTERTFVYFVQLAHSGREERKKRKEVSSC